MSNNQIVALDVYLHQRCVGKLFSEKASLSFQYTEAYLENPNALKLSASLPLCDTLFDHATSHAFFSGLLPDEDVRYRLAKYLNLSEKNTFALLKAIGGECAGAVALHPEKSSPQINPIQASYRVLNENESHDILSHLKQNPMLAREDNVRISGAGAQDKLMISMLDGNLAIPIGGTVSTHIVKPAIPELKYTVQNEFFCMQLAQKIGLEVPHTEIIWIKEKPYYLIERYDRTNNRNGQWQRLHQEDFCQALGLPPEIKYENEGGPSLINCFAFIEQRIQHGRMSAKSKIRLLQYIIFHFLIGNGDAHAKNFSIIYDQESERLAPVYDALCTIMYTHPSKATLAMKLGGQKRFQFVREKHWIALSNSLNMRPSFLFSTLSTLSKKIKIASTTLVSKLNQDEKTACSVYEEIDKIIQKQSRQLPDKS